jgi:hypothetical protein
MRILNFFIALIACNIVFGQAIISPRLKKIISEQPESFQRVGLLLTDRFDIVGLDEKLNSEKADQKTRVKLVVSNLQEKARATQPGVIEFLNNSGQVRPQSIKPLWITNMIFCTVKSSYIETLAKRNDIQSIDLDATLQQSEYKNELNLPLFFSPQGAEPGLKAINAHKLWALGYTGYGRTAYVADTGIDPIHPAYANKARSLFVPQDQTWFDMGGSLSPSDCGDHGSHCLGTIIGLDRLANDTVGVAFNGQWMGGKILCGSGTLDNLLGLQWAINPDGDVNTVTDMPDVINNSWYDPGISDDCASGYIDVEAALEAAGIASIFSAGNAGPDPQTITPPHNINMNLVNSFTIGALNGNSAIYPIADFSSRGPSKCGGTGSLLIKPEVSAPGVFVRSCTYNKQYDLKSGTSMASPHTCGAVLLLKEAFPYLSGFDLKLALYNTCTDLGEPGEDNVFGQGLINVWAAYNYLIGQGNTPVDPHRQNDLILIDVEVEPFQCEQTVRSIAHIENAGTDTVYHFVFEFVITNKLGVPTNHNQIWNGILKPGERLSLPIDQVYAEVGESTIDFEIVQVNNGIDGGPLNNRVKKKILIVNNPIHTVNFAAGKDVSLCNGTKAEVTSSFDKPGRVDWYDAQNGGKKLGTGNPFLLSPITKSDTIFMQAVYADVIGRTDIDEPLNEDTNKPYGGLRMTVNYPFILKSVKIYNTTKGVRKIELLNNGTSIFSKSVTLSTTGESRVVLNFPVPVGDNIRLVLADEAKPLAYSLGQSTFPYHVDNVLSIDGNIEKPSDAYCYFYDWQIEYDDFCGRVPLKIPFIQTQPLSAGFIVADTSFILKGLGADVQFIDTSLNASMRNWWFSNGTTSLLSQPVINFQNDGLYTAKLTVSNDDGCFDTKIKNFYILADTTTSTSGLSFDSAYKLYPNPSAGSFVIESSEITTLESRISIFNNIGAEVHTEIFKSSDLKWFVDVKQLPVGLYLIKLTNGKDNFVTKLIIE